MEWLDEFHGKTVCIDTAPLIYFIEEHPAYLHSVKNFFEAMEQDEFKVVTSTVTLLEVLVHPLRTNNKDLAKEYKEILLNSKLVTLDISSGIAEQAAQLRATYNIRTPDAIQLGAALNSGASYFFTNDVRLPEIPSIKIISLDAMIN
jgi:predicted nucleic acid-binding protein